MSNDNEEHFKKQIVVLKTEVKKLKYRLSQFESANPHLRYDKHTSDGMKNREFLKIPDKDKDD